MTGDTSVSHRRVSSAAHGQVGSETRPAKAGKAVCLVTVALRKVWFHLCSTAISRFELDQLCNRPCGRKALHGWLCAIQSTRPRQFQPLCMLPTTRPSAWRSSAADFPKWNDVIDVVFCKPRTSHRLVHRGMTPIHPPFVGLEKLAL